MANKKIQVILLEDVPKTGRKFDVEDVSMGYFRNYLLPNGLAEPATEEILASLEQERKKAAEEREKRKKAFQKEAKELEGTTLTFEAKVGDNDQLYGSISAKDIEERLQEKNFTDVSVKLSDPIKELGGTEVRVEFGEGVATTINIDVTKEEK